MKLGTLIIVALVSTSGLTQNQPIELQAHRVPKTKVSGDVLIKGARIFTITKGVIAKGDVLVQKGKIAAIGSSLAAPSGVPTIDATGMALMPGIVDTHTHRGIEGVNEGAEAITAEARVVDVLNPDAKAWWQALASGHTSGLFLHGSANQVGGESLVAKYKYRKTVKEAIFPGAPRQIKFALGENVTNKNSTTQTQYPRTRMGVEAGYRRAFQAAKEYRQRRNRGENVPKDVRLETLADVLEGKVWVQCHSYRADEMLMMVRLSQEFGFKLGTLQHALEAYKIAPEMAKAGVGAGMFMDNWAFKIEAYDAIPFNAAICQLAGVSGLGGTTALNLDAARTMHYGGVTEAQALAMLTINPARQIGVDARVGSIEVGKDADLCLWRGHPLSVRSKPMMTFVDGELLFERRDAFGIDGLSQVKSELDPITYEVQKLLPAAKGYAIVGATAYPVSSEPIEDSTILVSDGKITGVGQRLKVPRGYKVISGRGLKVMPGFIDGANTIGLTEVSGLNTMNDNNEMGDFQPDLDGSKALFVENAYMGTALWNGVTHSFTRPTSGIVSGQGALIHHTGYTTEEQTQTAKVALNINFPMGLQTGGFGIENMCCGAGDWAAIGLPWLDGRLAPPTDHDHEDGHDHDDMAGQGGGEGGGGDQARTSDLQKYIDSVREYAKGPRFPVDLRMEAMIPYVEGKKLVVLRVRNAESIRNAVAFGQKNGFKFALEGADDAWRVADFLAKEKVPVIINPAGRSTLSANNTVNDWDPYDTPYVQPYLLAKAGVKFCFTSGGNSEAMSLPFRVGAHMAYGLTWEQALRALTLDAATTFGVDGALGSIREGMPANFIAVAGDPFEPTSNVRFAFVNGKPAELVSKHTALRDKYLRRVSK